MINVMIADDDYNARTGLAEMIDWQSLGAQVVAVAEDGEQAVNILQTTPNIDLIILDICMPYLDGLQVAKYIRQNEYETDIILLSAHAEFEYAREALKYDIREYIIKPVNRSKLIQLTDIIKKISFQKEEEIKWNLFTHGSELQNMVRSSLQSKSIAQFEDILDGADNFTGINAKKYKEYYLIILSLMREYCQNIDCAELNSDCYERFHALADVKGMREFLVSTFTTLLSSDKADSKQNSGNVVILVKQYIQDNILSPDIHSSTVADKFNLSVDHISRLFKSAGDTSLSDYIIKAKIDKAKEFIENTDHSIRHIAQILGYADPNYFVRVFKKRTGVTPTEYRTITKEGSG